MLEQKSDICHGNNLKLVVTCETEVDEIHENINSYSVTDDKAATLGHGYNFCIEDATDKDYNDIYINLIGWAKIG